MKDVQAISWETSPLCATVDQIQPIPLVLVYQTSLEALWDDLVRQYHYLGYRKMLGARLKYMALYNKRPIACIGFSSAMLKVEVRDRFIGWTEEQKGQYLPHVANNSRFLILPGVKVKNLASHLLARALKQAAFDWQRLYGCELWLVETFVDPAHFRGTCYKAANWIRVG